jgi:hypothetical protein
MHVRVVEAACALTPADTRTTTTQMKTEPAQIVTSGDGSGYVKDLAWSGSSSTTAHGRGILEVDDCTPNCAQETYTCYPATVTLSGLTSYGHGLCAYSVVATSAPSAGPRPRHSGQHHLRRGCLRYRPGNANRLWETSLQLLRVAR